MSTTSEPEAQSVDANTPSWIKIGRSNALGIGDDLIAAASECVHDLALAAVVLHTKNSQPPLIQGKLRGETLASIPSPELVECLNAASASARTAIPDTTPDTLRAQLHLQTTKIIPLDTPETRVGLLLVGWESAEYPQADDIIHLTNLCQQAAFAIENLTLRHQIAHAERQKRDDDTLVGAACDLAACLNSNELYRKIVSHAKDLVGAQLSYLALFDEKQNNLVIVTTSGERSNVLNGTRIPMNEGIAAQAVRDRTTMKASDLPTDPRRRPAWEGVRLAEDIHGSIWVPIFAGPRLLGLLQVANRHVTEFTEEEAILLQRLADIAAVAMENARAYEKQNYANMELARLSQINVARCSEAQRQASAAIALASALWSSKGFDALAAALCKWLNNAVIVCNLSRNMLVCKVPAGSDVAPADQVLLAALAQPESQLSTTLAKLRSHSHPVRVAVPGIQDTSISCVVTAIITGEAPAGYLIVPESLGALQESDLIVLESAIPFFAAELLRRREVSRARESLGADLLLDLLEGGATEHSTSQARLLGCALDEKYGVALFHIGSNAKPPDQRQKRKPAEAAPELLLAAVRAELELPSYSTGFALSALHDGCVVVVIPKNLQANQWKEMQASLAAQFPHTPITVSVSESFKGIAGILPMYRNVLWIMQAALQLGRVGRVVQSEELGVYRLLGKTQRREDLVQFARDVLGGLLREDPRHKPDLLPTLDAYLRNSCRLHETAKALFVHPHTLRYRINRIEEVLGRKVDDSAWREEAQLALAIARVEYPELFKSS